MVLEQLQIYAKQKKKNLHTDLTPDAKINSRRTVCITLGLTINF